LRKKIEKSLAQLEKKRQIFDFKHGIFKGFREKLLKKRLKYISGIRSNESINAIHNFKILTYKIKHGFKFNYKRIITLIENFDII